jgi:prolyl-tRNA editing enzyme YbaK/EbsC (Cys-tRNA(Pro) deacylase)
VYGGTAVRVPACAPTPPDPAVAAILPGMIGRLETVPADERPDLLAAPVAQALAAWDGPAVHVAEIDPTLADTAAFCAHYDVELAASANCVVVSAKRGQEQRLAACVVLATTRVDVNGLVRRQLDARKASFAPTEVATSETGMEYGGITPFGLPSAWPLLVDAAAAAAPYVVLGSGLRRSKLVVAGAALADLPRSQVLTGLGTASSPA